MTLPLVCKDYCPLGNANNCTKDCRHFTEGIELIEAMKQYTHAEHFDTPVSAVKPLLPYIPDGTIWECTDTYGRSGITKCLREAGRIVETSSINDGIDFLTWNVDGWDVVITNPPFNKKTDFIRKCIAYDKPFALLLPLTALEGIQRHNLWKSIESDLGLLVLDKRTDFTGGGVWFNTSWYCYKFKFKGLKFARVEV